MQTSWFLYNDNPVLSEFQREFLVQSIDERRSILVQKGHESDGAFLRVTVWKRERPGADELPPERLIASLRGVNHLPLERL